MFESFLFLCGQSSVVDLLPFGRRDVADTLKEPPVVEPVHPFKRGKLHVLEGLPGSLPSDELGLVEADHGLGEGIVIT